MQKQKCVWILIGLWFGLIPLSLAQVRKDYPRYPSINQGAPGLYSSQRLKTFRGTYKGIYTLKIQLYVDPQFSASQRSLIQDAMEIFVERNHRSDVLDCAYKASKKDLPSSREDFETRLFTALAPLNVEGLTRPSFAFIGFFEKEEKIAGLGFLGLFYDRSQPMQGYESRHYLHVALNSDLLGFDSGYGYAKDKEYWAGVLGHEFLHNLGYDHPTGYEGSFIKEYENCIWMNGKRVDLPAGLASDVVVKPPRT